jgi:multicomponent Na+:H+ antiporter subunit A
LWVGPVVLTGLSLLFGLFPEFLGRHLLTPAVTAVIGQPSAVDLALWHGITPSLVLSVLTLILGAGLYLQRDTVRRYAQRLTFDWGPARLYDRALDALNGAARWQTGILQSGYLRYYLLTILLTTIALVGLALFGGQAERWWLIDSLPAFDRLDAHFYELVLAGVILLATVAVTLLQSSLSAVAAMGIVGYGVALMYLLFGAPDLAMTQLLVESLTVILFVLAFYHLPDFSALSRPASRVRDALIALGVGGLMTTLVLLAVSIQFRPSIAQYFVDMALPRGHGRNIVNVILVDFRALDTLGEITVLGIAAIGVYALLKLPRENAK